MKKRNGPTTRAKDAEDSTPGYQPNENTSSEDEGEQQQHSHSQFDNGDNVASFIRNLADVLNNPKYHEIISWDPSGTKVLVHDVKRFESEVLTAHYKTNSIAAFQRSLNLYGFYKDGTIDKKNWCNTDFTKHAPEKYCLLKRNTTKTRPADLQLKREHAALHAATWAAAVGASGHSEERPTPSRPSSSTSSSHPMVPLSEYNALRSGYDSIQASLMQSYMEVQGMGRALHTVLAGVLYEREREVCSPGGRPQPREPFDPSRVLPGPPSLTQLASIGLRACAPQVMACIQRACTKGQGRGSAWHGMHGIHSDSMLDGDGEDELVGQHEQEGEGGHSLGGLMGMGMSTGLAALGHTSMGMGGLGGEQHAHGAYAMQGERGSSGLPDVTHRGSGRLGSPTAGPSSRGSGGDGVDEDGAGAVGGSRAAKRKRGNPSHGHGGGEGQGLRKSASHPNIGDIADLLAVSSSSADPCPSAAVGVPPPHIQQHTSALPNWYTGSGAPGVGGPGQTAVGTAGSGFGPGFSAGLALGSPAPPPVHTHPGKLTTHAAPFSAGLGLGLSEGVYASTGAGPGSEGTAVQTESLRVSDASSGVGMPVGQASVYTAGTTSSGSGGLGVLGSPYAAYASLGLPVHVGHSANVMGLPGVGGGVVASA